MYICMDRSFNTFIRVWCGGGGFCHSQQYSVHCTEHNYCEHERTQRVEVTYPQYTLTHTTHMWLCGLVTKVQ